MLDIGVGAEKDKNEWPLGEFAKGNIPKESNRVMRKFINSAIYVEKPLLSTISSESIPVPQKVSSEDLLQVNTKRCTCSVNQKSCPCHCSSFFTFIPRDERKSAVAPKVSENKTKISQSLRFSNNTDDGKEQLLKKWVAKKEAEKRKKDIERKMMLQAKMREREMLLEQERNNFQKWLTNKKKLEEKAKRKKEKEFEEQQLRELEKEKRQLENQLNFQLWVKKKEEILLEKKIKKQMEVISALEYKEKQLIENERAFNEWLQNSKTKQKPVPLNRGIESLYSSSSVTYVNPKPWNPVS